MIEQAPSFMSMESSSYPQVGIQLDSLNPSSNSAERIITALIQALYHYLWYGST